MYDIAIIGGGASGVAAAITSLRLGKKVIIFENKDRILKKVLTTGNGRCNFSNTTATYTNYHGRDDEFTSNVLEKYPSTAIVDFFKTIGIVPSYERDNRVYPMSGQASSVVDALRLELEHLKADIRLGTPVIEIYKRNDIFNIKTINNDIIKSKAVIVSTGGNSMKELGSDGSGYEILKKMSHHITELKPAMVQLSIEKEYINGLEGIRLDVNLKAYHTTLGLLREENDELLFASYGISGPSVFKLAYLTAKYDYDSIYFLVDFFPQYTKEDIVRLLQERKKNIGHLSIEYLFNGLVNKKLGQFLTKKAGIEKLNFTISELDDNIIIKIADLLKSYYIPIIETMGFKIAQVTYGGVYTNEINKETLESKIHSGLFLSGEVLDVCGDCGGYNLQWAFSSGIVAGENACKYVCNK